MSETIDRRYKRIRPALDAIGQAHVLAFWKELSEEQKLRLLDDLEQIDIGALPELGRLATQTQQRRTTWDSFAPAPVIPRESVGGEIVERGRSLLTSGKVAALTVAGGQGTRLGFDGPKGALPISPVKNKSLFQLFAESILASQRRYKNNEPIAWYIMTSPANDRATQSFFRTHRFFGLAPGQVRFFQQGVMPALDREGRLLLRERHRLALSPDGHGGCLLALAKSGMLADMAGRGIELVSYFQVDNPLVACLDPAFIGLHDERGSEMSSKTLPKADDLERVGNFLLADGRLTVIEYIDFVHLPDEVVHGRTETGSRKYDAANAAIHLLSRSFLERITAGAAGFALPWHVAAKKVPHIDLNTGRRNEPDATNGIKLEAFIFDALPLAANLILMGTSRAEEFSPVKNKTGVDSVETARLDMSRRAARWLEQAGVKVPRDEHGEPTAFYEISPMVALDAEEFKECQRTGEANTLQPTPTSRGVYLGT